MIQFDASKTNEGEVGGWLKDLFESFIVTGQPFQAHSHFV